LQYWETSQLTFQDPVIQNNHNQIIQETKEKQSKAMADKLK